MRRFFLVSLILVIISGLPGVAFATQNDWGLLPPSDPLPPPQFTYPEDNAQQKLEVPQWLIGSIRHQIAQHLNEDFGTLFQVINQDEENPDAFVIFSNGNGREYWAYITMQQLPTPKDLWYPGFIFQIDGYGVGNGEVFWLYGFYSPESDLKLKIYK